MSPEDLTPSIVLQWLRLQANKYSDTARRYTDTADKFSQAADVLESTVEAIGKPAQAAAGPSTPAPHTHTRLFAQGAASSS